MDKYFNVPTQVAFKDPELDYEENIEEFERWCFGIAYRDEVICGCCGGVFELNEITTIVPMEWADIATKESIGNRSEELYAWLEEKINKCD